MKKKWIINLNKNLIELVSHFFWNLLRIALTLWSSVSYLTILELLLTFFKSLCNKVTVSYGLSNYGQNALGSSKNDPIVTLLECMELFALINSCCCYWILFFIYCNCFWCWICRRLIFSLSNRLCFLYFWYFCYVIESCFVRWEICCS